MKTLLTAVVSLFFLNSCVFEAPFEAEAKIPADMQLLGRWEEVPGKADEEKKPDQMLILQHSANEFVVEYPIGAEAMYFRAFAVELAGGKYIQIQLIGSADKPLKAVDRKYHLLKVSVEGDAFQMSTIEAEVLGKDLKDSAQMKAAFAAHKDDPKLFGDAVKFRRIK
jgi:hypothetical protein